jgi:hypothetical protein
LNGKRVVPVEESRSFGAQKQRYKPSDFVEIERLVTKSEQ